MIGCFCNKLRFARKKFELCFNSGLVIFFISASAAMAGIAVADDVGDKENLIAKAVPGDIEIQAKDSAYEMGAGDKLRITVFGHEDLSGEFQVAGNGSISMPLIGTIDADGLSPSELEVLIIDALQPDYLKNPRVSVEVLNYRPFYIIGEVKNPGSYPYVNGMTVINAIALAGGYTYRGRQDRVYIIHANDPERNKTKATLDAVVLPGDVIEVPERFF